jgi:transposase
VGRGALAADQKKADQEQRTIIFVDEAAFYLLPMAVSTWAPVGQTPMLSVPLERDHLSAISGITPDGRVFLQVRKQAYDGEAVVQFLRVLLRKVPGKLLIIWDRATIHRSHRLKAFLASGAAKRIHLELLPGYAPELNPDEGIWQYLKRYELRNVCCTTLAHLEQEVIRARERLRHKRTVIRSCFALAGYFCF